MKNILTTAILFASTCVAATVGASAQTHLVQAKVPFSFTVGSKTLPAGTYTISSTGLSPIVSIESANSAGVRTLSLPSTPTTGENPTLVFHKVGDQYFLTEMRGNSAISSLRFSPGKQERQAEARMVEAKMHTDSTVLVALR